MPMPDYVAFDLARVRPGQVVLTATADPWRPDYPDTRTETVTARPRARILTDHGAYWWHGAQMGTWWQFYRYPRRIIAAA